MKIEAEVSLYPLRTATLGPMVASFLECLRSHDVSVEPGAMSSRVSGEADAVFLALSEAFKGALAGGQAVLIVKASNACPLGPGWGELSRERM